VILETKTHEDSGDFTAANQRQMARPNQGLISLLDPVEDPRKRDHEFVQIVHLIYTRPPTEGQPKIVRIVHIS
jgi:hypothetical protein